MTYGELENGVDDENQRRSKSMEEGGQSIILENMEDRLQESESLLDECWTGR